MSKVRALLPVFLFCMAVLCQAQKKPVVYIYNKVSPNKGFTIMSEDKDGKPLLLGYSDKECFDTDNIPDNVAWWLSQYLGTDTNDVGYQLLPADNRRESSSPVVGPLLDTHWNQDAPYNMMCPKWFGTPTMVGCVPLAVAQILRYYQWPVVGKDSITYYCREMMMDISADFSQSRYDYDNMPSELNDQSTEEQKTQISKLLYDCGVALKAEFWTTVTNALTNDVDEALVKYFRYDDDIQVMLRQNDTTEWEAVIRHELDEGRPVYYSGKGKDGGHAFVCDGYDNNGMYHFNFGWGGKYDGYYRFNHIGNDNIDYSDKQQIFYNIKPNSEIVDIPCISSFATSDKDDIIYDMSGRRIGDISNKKGIFIVGGHKVIR